MQCINPECESKHTSVVETNSMEQAIWRRRCCDLCGTKYVTVETFAKQQRVPKKPRKKNALQTE